MDHERMLEQGEANSEVEQVREALEALNGNVLDVLARHVPANMHRELVALSYAATLRAANSAGLDPMEFLVWSPRPR